MVVNRKPTGRASAMPAGLATGALTAVGVTLAGAAVLAKLIEAGGIAENSSGYGIMMILLAASWLGSVVACRKIKRQLLAVCLMSGAVYFGILMLTTALFFGGRYSGVGETALLIICGSMLAVLWEFRGKRTSKRPKIKGRNR